MGGRGASSSQRGGTKVLQIGDETIELDSELVYGDKDDVYSQTRLMIEQWENKRFKNKVEYAVVYDASGRIVGTEIKGGKTRASIPRWYVEINNGTLSHVHPREKGILGGTFSYEDMRHFANYNLRSYRATTKEGTYSITKGKNFNKDGFKEYVRSKTNEIDGRLNSLHRGLQDDVYKSKMTSQKAQSIYDREFNKGLVELHNAFRAGQKKYGYTYSLERR